MAAAAHPVAADTELTRTTPFAKSEWESEYATDMSYPGVSAALGEEAGAGPVLSLTCKLVHAAQYRPAGRPYLTCCFTAMRQAVSLTQSSEVIKLLFG